MPGVSSTESSLPRGKGMPYCFLFLERSLDSESSKTILTISWAAKERSSMEILVHQVQQFKSKSLPVK